MIRATVAATVAVGLCATVAAAAEIDVGGITASMSFEQVQARIGPGSIECEHVQTAPAIERLCRLVIETDTQSVVVGKDPSGNTIWIGRAIPLPDSLSNDDALAQVTEKYRAFGSIETFGRSMIYLACQNECGIGVAPMFANITETSTWPRALFIQFTDRAAESRNADRIRAEMEAAKPRLPL